LRNADTFGDDSHNDDTFGDDAPSDPSALPNFFQHHGKTVLDELGHLGDADEDEAEDDILYEAGAFGTGLSDFFKPEYGNVSNAVYDSWMGAATGEDSIPAPEDDALERELEQAQRELESFVLDPSMLDEPYQQGSSVTISLPAQIQEQAQTAPRPPQAPPTAPPTAPATAPAQTGKKLSGTQLGNLLSGKAIGSSSTQAGSASVAPSLSTTNIAPPLFPGTQSPPRGPAPSPSIAASLGGPAPAAPKPQAPGGPWNKPIHDFNEEPANAKKAPRGPGPRPQGQGQGQGRGQGQGQPHQSQYHQHQQQHEGGRGGRGWNGAAPPGAGYQPQRYGGRGGPPPRGPGPNGPNNFGPPPFPGGNMQHQHMHMQHMHMNHPMNHMPGPGGPGGFGPPPFPGGPPPFSGGPPPMQGDFGGPSPPRPPPMPHGEKMRRDEVRFVLSKVLDPLKMQDPYSDDFYSIQLAIKKNNENQAAAAKNNFVAPIAFLQVPLPIWQAAKDRILHQLASSKQEQTERTAVWEKKEHVLGHVTRLDPSRPRMQLSFGGAGEGGGAAEEAADGSMPKATYGTVLWNMRAAVSRGFNALYTVQELHQLLNTPMIVSEPKARADILNEVSSALSLLSRSVGILPPHITATAAPGAAVDSLAPASSEVVLEGGLVAALLQTIKGKKLITRSMRHLTTTQRWALTPVILARTLQAVNAKSADGKSSEEEVVEQRLMKVLVQVRLLLLFGIE
jgi:hypothetical protein